MKVAFNPFTGNFDLVGSGGGTGGSADWGDIGGTLSNQTDLQTALDGKQPLDSDLTTIAGLTATTDNFIVSVSSAWASRTPSQVRSTLGLVIGTNVQAWDADLDTIAGLTATTNNFMVASGSAWASRTPTQAIAHLGLDADLATFALPASTTISAFGATLVDDADAATARTTLGVVAGGAGDIWVEKAGDTMTGQLMLDGSSDTIQLLVQGNGTQTALLAVFESSAGTDQITFSALGAAVFNEAGNDADFRIESDNQANMFFVDASTDFIGIYTASPAVPLHINYASGWAVQVGQSSGLYYRISPNQLAAFNNGSGSALLFNHDSSGDVNMATGGGKVGVGTQSPDARLDVDGSASYIFKGEPASDHTAHGPKMSMINGGEAITIMNLVYISTSDGEWHNADADAAATATGMLGIALATGSDGASLLVALPGSIVRDDSWAWSAAGLPLYISGTTGAITDTKPTGADDIVRIVGFSVSDDAIYFFPEPGHVELV